MTENSSGNKIPDIRTLVQLISAYSLVDPEKAKVLTKHLPLSDSISKGRCGDSQKSGDTYLWKEEGWKSYRRQSAKGARTGRFEKEEEEKKGGKLPKNYDPKATPRSRKVAANVRTFLLLRKKEGGKEIRLERGPRSNRGSFA